tara:strand:+ start:3786 stop:3965 length:180 start_codon:yes stop_codon:yes gene_type:complete
MSRETKTEEDARMMAEWLAKGNEITICDPGARSDPDEIGYTWGKKKKKAVDPKVVDKKK